MEKPIAGVVFEVSDLKKMTDLFNSIGVEYISEKTSLYNGKYDHAIILRHREECDFMFLNGKFIEILL